MPGTPRGTRSPKKRITLSDDLAKSLSDDIEMSEPEPDIIVMQNPLTARAIASPLSPREDDVGQDAAFAVLSPRLHVLEDETLNFDSDSTDSSDEDDSDDENPILHRRVFHRKLSAVNFAVDELTPMQLKATREAFDVIDIDGNDYLSTSELNLIVRILGLHSPKGGTKEDVDMLMEALDTDHDDRVSFDEFVAAIKAGHIELFSRADGAQLDEFGVPIIGSKRSRKAPPFNIRHLLKVKQAFKTADADGDGFIKKKEFYAVKTSLRKSVPILKFNHIWRTLDKQGTWNGAPTHVPGQVTWMEFLYGLAELPKKLRRYLDFATIARADSLLVNRIFNEEAHTKALNKLNMLERFGVKMLRRLSQEQQQEKRVSRIAHTLDKHGHTASTLHTLDKSKSIQSFEMVDVPEEDSAQADEYDDEIADNEITTTGAVGKLIESSMNKCIFRVGMIGALASAICAAADVLAEYTYASLVLDDGTVIPSIKGVIFVKSPILAFAAVLEICWLYYDTLVECMALATFVGLVLWPLDDIRSSVAVNLTRAALEMGGSHDNVLHINALKEASTLKVALVAIIYKAKMGVSKFAVKLGVKRVMTRCGVRETSSLAWAGFAAVPVGFIWNAVVCRAIIREARVRALGARIALSLTDKMMEEWGDKRLRPLVRIQCLRIIGITIVKAQDVHPNVEILLKRLYEYFQQLEKDPDRNRMNTAFNSTWSNLEKSQRKAAKMLGYFPPKGEEGLSNKALGHRRWPRHDNEKHGSMAKHHWPPWQEMSAKHKTAAEELGLFEQYYPPGVACDLSFQLKLDHEQTLYKNMDADNLPPGEGLTEEESAFVFRLFLLCICLDGKVMKRQVPYIHNMVALMGFDHPQCLLFAELWIKDTTVSLRAGEPIRLRATQQNAFGHLDIMGILSSIQQSATKWDEKHKKSKKKPKWNPLPEMAELQARHSKNQIYACIDGCLSLFSC